MDPIRSPAWHDAQYNNRARLPDYAAALQRWADASRAARERAPSLREFAYGADPSERLDLFAPRSPGAPVLVFLHGGYWRALDKRDHSFVAPPFVDAGALVVVPNYALCPAVTIAQIVEQTAHALAWVHRHAGAHGGDPRRIVVAGHSAGGQLAALALARDWPAFASDLPADLVASALSISGLFDLEPLRHAPFLAGDLRLDAAAVQRLSPARRAAPPRGALVSVVGGDESEEFIRQHALIGQAWGGRAIASDIVPGRHHLSVLEDLADPASTTHRRALQLLGLQPARVTTA